MKTITETKKYQAWLSPEIMHRDSKKWLSTLRFIKDEELFFCDLVKSYTLALIKTDHYLKSQTLVANLSMVQSLTQELIHTINNHDKRLKIMVDGLNQIKEENLYKKEHGKLIITVSEFLDEYRTLKSKLFTFIKIILKEGKQKCITA